MQFLNNHILEMKNDLTFQNKIATILSDVLSRDIPAASLTEETNLIDDIGLNSLDFLQFILGLENEFDVEIDIGKLDLKYFKKLGLLNTFIDETIVNKNVT